MLVWCKMVYGVIIMYENTEEVYEFIANRINKLREQAGASARDMSLSIGQNSNYINKIESKQANTSIEGLTYICDYFGITLFDFFNTESGNPVLVKTLIQEANRLDDKSLEHLIGLAQQLNNKK